MSQPSPITASSDDATLVGEGVGPAQAALGELVQGVRIARYLLLDRIGRGSMGAVYSAYDPELDRRVALKLMPCPTSDEDVRRTRFLGEAKAMARIDHPNVVSVHDAGVHGEWLWVAMALVDGPSVDAWLRQRRSQREILDVFIGAGRGLDAAHRAGVVHRDFKPGNVIVGPGDVAKVVDFGLAGVEEPTTDDDDAPARAIGTPAYMSPEHIEGARVDARSDQFSYCVAFAEAVYGERPYTGDGLPELARRIVQGELAPRIAYAPGGLARLLRRGLSPDPEQRFPSMAELLGELERVRGGSRARWFFAAAGLGVLAVAGFVVLSGDACSSGASRVDAFWNPGARAAIQIGGEAYTPEFVAQAEQRYAAGVDAYASRWAEAYDSSCRAVGPHGAAGTQDERRTAECLDNRLASLRGLVEFVAARPTDAGAVDDLVDALPVVEECARPGWVPWPADPEEAATARAIYARIERLQWARLADASVGLLDEAREVESEARDLGNVRVLVLALRELARIEANEGDTAAFDAHLDEALELALAGGHDHEAAIVINELVMGRKGVETTSPELVRLAAVGVALAKRAEADVVAANLLVNVSNALGELRDYDRALAALDDAAEHYERAGEADSVWRVQLNEVLIRLQRGQQAEALPLARELRSRIVREHGEDSLARFHADRVLCVALMGAGEYQEALEITRSLLARVRLAYVPGSFTLHEVAWMHAAAAVHLGHIEEARVSFELAAHPTAKDPDTVAGLRSWIAMSGNQLAEAARVLEDALAVTIGDRRGGLFVVELQRAYLHVLVGELEEARALLSRPQMQTEAMTTGAYGAEYALVAMAADLGPPPGTKWAAFLATKEADMSGTRMLREAARAMALESVPEVRAARERLANATFEMSPDVRLIDVWLARHAAGP